MAKETKVDKLIIKTEKSFLMLEILSKLLDIPEFKKLIGKSLQDKKAIP